MIFKKFSKAIKLYPNDTIKQVKVLFNKKLHDKDLLEIL